MNYDVLTPGQKTAYLGVLKYKEENPDASNSQAFKALKINPSTYAAARVRLGKNKARKKYTRRPKMLTLPIPVNEVPKAGEAVAFCGTPDGVVQAVRLFLRGN